MVLLFQHPLYYHQRMYFLLFLPWYEYEWFRIYSSIWLIFVPWTSRCFRTIIAIFYCIIHRCYYTNVFCIIYLCIAYFPYNGAQFSNITSLFFSSFRVAVSICVSVLPAGCPESPVIVIFPITSIYSSL